MTRTTLSPEEFARLSALEQDNLVPMTVAWRAPSEVAAELRARRMYEAMRTITLQSHDDER